MGKVEEAWAKKLAEKLGLGPTGRFPNGKWDESNEGELKIAIGIENDAVVIHFGKAILWMGMSPKNARELAANLMEMADELEAMR